MNQEFLLGSSPAVTAGAGPRGLRLFGVFMAERGRAEEEDVEEVMRKSASTGNLASCVAGAAAGVEQGYLSDVGPIGGSRRPRTGDRKRGVPWTEEEHKTFLAGLKKHGKGDWKGISRDFVPTRTPTQVASHAQKYFLRHSNPDKKKRRCSLFDVVIDETANNAESDPHLSLKKSNETAKRTDHLIHINQDNYLVDISPLNTIHSITRGPEPSQPLSAKIDYNSTPTSQSVNFMLENVNSMDSSFQSVIPNSLLPNVATPIMLDSNSASFAPDFLQLQLSLSSPHCPVESSAASSPLLENLELSIAPPQPHLLRVW